MARWVEISARRPEAVEPVISGQVGPKLNLERNPKGAGRRPSGINRAARDLGVSCDQVARSVKIASLSPAAKATGRDAPQAVLLAAARETEPATQVAAMIEARLGKAAPVEPEPGPEPGSEVGPDPEPDPAPDSPALYALKAAWRGASPAPWSGTPPARGAPDPPPGGR